MIGQAVAFPVRCRAFRIGGGGRSAGAPADHLLHLKARLAALQPDNPANDVDRREDDSPWEG